MPAEPRRDADADLVERSRRGDAAGFAELVRRHQGRVRAYLSTCVRRADVADDLAQEVFLAALRTLDTFRGDSPLGVWLLGIARHRALAYLRDDGARRAREGTPLEAAFADWRLARVDGEAADLNEREHALRALERCVEALPRPSAALVAEHYFRGRSLAEMAKVGGRKDGALRMALLRVRQLLRDCVRQRIAIEGSERR